MSAARPAPMPRPFVVTCGDQKPRHAASIHGARRTMGKMMNNVPKGTRGAITCNGTVVLIAECTSLGWHVVDERWSLQIVHLLIDAAGRVLDDPSVFRSARRAS